jgi:hypothetical protein
MKKDENGYIVVETIGSFTLFVLFMASILTLINVTTVQARVHYALTQTANELATYSYVVHASEIADTGFMENLDAITAFIGNVLGSEGEPKTFLNVVYEALAFEMMKKYLSIGSITDADTYLRNSNVINGMNGISLENSRMLDENGDILLVADYRINYSFGLGAFPLPANMRTLNIRQTAMTKAWLGGVDYE